MIQLPENLFSISCNIHCLDDKIIKETGNLGDKLTSQCMDVSVLFRVYFKTGFIEFQIHIYFIFKISFYVSAILFILICSLY